VRFEFILAEKTSTTLRLSPRSIRPWAAGYVTTYSPPKFSSGLRATTQNPCTSSSPTRRIGRVSCWRTEGLATKTLPEGEELPVEPEVVEPLVRAAIHAALRDLRGTPPHTRVTTVYRATETGMRSDDVERPSYFKTFPESLGSARSSPEAVALTDYLWSRGQLKKSLSRDRDAVPTKEAWAGFTWDDLILVTVWYLADRAVTEDVSLGRSHEPWRCDPDDIDDAVAELVGLLSGGELILTAVCPVRACRFPEEGVAFEIEPGVLLEPWRSGANQTVFLTRFHSEYLPDDTVLWNTHAAVRMRLRLPVTVDAIDSVVAILDRFLWASMIARGNQTVVGLGSAVLRSATRHVRTVIHRLDAPWATSTVKPIGWHDARWTTGLHPALTFLERAKDLLATLAKASFATAELATAVWAFGRSCSAQSARDVLLEAAIGLERLLVSEGRGDLAYRFRLHGAAILVDEPDAFDDFKRIYDLRSKAAHGAAGKHSTNFEAMAPRARYLLARAIQSIALLINSSELIITKDQDVAAAIAALVRRRVTKS
jgi:hypothetical protein